ncbi:mediator of RNA polymerase II transcription subunit 11-like [Saccoglossus kowalevskii]|uniref:Mediator of RNA polymerase II transcription subunit 11 n=1 Tax=Saccoglossus kowalevskii TaxID=10224 RepID=A0ABM0GTA8_SACKO|nr:PREDICTED: mediator of RNA polymerase II transcription subunit 11-like [Saccoglossus kowalevskii]
MASKMATSVNERLLQLDSIEKEVSTILLNAGQAIQELSKEKPNEANLELYTQKFLKSLETVEGGLTKQINYLSQVSTGHPHEGSSYSAQKEARMALHRLEHARMKLNELSKTCTGQP